MERQSSNKVILKRLSSKIDLKQEWHGAGPYGHYTPCPLPVFCPWKTFSQRISFHPRSENMVETKWKWSKETKHNNLVIKHSQGHLIPSQGLSRWFQPCPMSCLIETETPTKWKKLTIWWPDHSHDTSCHVTPWTGPKEMETKNRLWAEGQLYLRRSRGCWSDH